MVITPFNYKIIRVSVITRFMSRMSNNEKYSTLYLGKKRLFSLKRVIKIHEFTIKKSFIKFVRDNYTLLYFLRKSKISFLVRGVTFVFLFYLLKMDQLYCEDLSKALIPKESETALTSYEGIKDLQESTRSDNS